jgi:flagella basal body P-ring formation protein FlgA
MTERVFKILPSAIKLILATIIMVVSMAAFIASINKANAATPKRNVTITGDNITLGDVFDDIYKNENYVLAPAPHPDSPLTWDAHTLNRLAKAFKLNWRPSSSDQITIRRLATVISEDMIQNAILNSFDGQAINTNMNLEFVGADPTIILPHDFEPTIEVETSSFNHERQTFSATLRTADDKTIHYKGIAHKIVQIPVLNKVLRRGDSIKQSMISMINIRENHITQDMVLRRDELIGMTPRKILRANEPVQLSQLDKPIMVKRGDLVTMQLKRGPIALTALAKAMESGTKGDMIRLVNMDSKRTLEAQITGLREATVYN